MSSIPDSAKARASMPRSAAVVKVPLRRVHSANAHAPTLVTPGEKSVPTSMARFVQPTKAAEPIDDTGSASVRFVSAWQSENTPRRIEECVAYLPSGSTEAVPSRNISPSEEARQNASEPTWETWLARKEVTPLFSSRNAFPMAISRTGSVLSPTLTEASKRSTGPEPETRECPPALALA